MTRFFLTSVALLACLQTSLAAQDTRTPKTSKPAAKSAPKVSATPGAIRTAPAVTVTTDSAALRRMNAAPTAVVGPQQFRQGQAARIQVVPMTIDSAAMRKNSGQAPAAKRPPPSGR